MVIGFLLPKAILTETTVKANKKTQTNGGEKRWRGRGKEEKERGRVKISRARKEELRARSI